MRAVSKTDVIANVMEELMRSLRPVHIVAALIAITLIAWSYRLGGMSAQSVSPQTGPGTSQAGKFQLLSAREQWYERNVPVVHEAVLMLDTETGKVWKLTDIYGEKKWEPIDPPVTSE